MAKKNGLRLTMLATLLAAGAAALAFSLAPRRGAATAPSAGQERHKKLRDAARERDVTVEGGLHSQNEYVTFEALATEPKAVVYGRLTDARSFFDESGDPREYGENITTEYTVEVLRVLRDKTRAAAPPPGRLAPAPLATPLKIARDGGTVMVDGHRAEVRYAGYEALTPGKEYVFFLFWSPDYRAYVLAGNISGVVAVEDGRRLKPFASSPTIRKKLRGADLDSLAVEVANSN